MKFPELDVNPDEMKYVGKGEHGIVYKISEDRVAKFGRIGDSIDLTGIVVQREYGIANGLYNGGVSVPKPFGVFEIGLPKNLEWGPTFNPLGLRRYPAFVMQFIDVPQNKIYTFSAEKIRGEVITAELEKARMLGFSPGDTGIPFTGPDNNVLWNDDGSQCYLIDFNNWGDFRK